MADEIVGLKLEVRGGDAVGKTVKSIRAELKEANEELIKLQQEFGELSPEALAAARNVAELRDRIQEATEVAGLFDPGKTFQSVVGVGSAIAAGFSAVQGAMALVGSESKEVEQAILKVQAAMALAQGLSAVRDSIKDFQRLGAMLSQITIVQKANAAANALAAGAMRLFGAATTQTGVAFNVLKTAIVSTGIGALIVGVGLLINKLASLTSSTNEAAEAQRQLNKEMVDFANKSAGEIANIYAEDAKLQVARAKARGASEEEIQRITRESNQKIEAELRRNRAALQAQGLDTAEATKALNRATTEAELFELGVREKARNEAEQRAKASRDKSKAAADKTASERKAAADAAKSAEQQTADEVFAIQHTAEEVELRALAEKFRQRREAYLKDGRDISELLVAQAIERGAIEKKYADERAAEQAAAAEKRRADNAAYIEQVIADQDAQTERERQYAEARKELAERERDAKIRAAQAVAGALDGFAALAGEQTAAGKAFAVTSATIQAILGAQQAFTAMSAIPIVGPALGAVAAAGAIAAGIANVKKILAVQVPGGKGGGGSAPSLGGVSTGGGPPLSPQANQPQTTKIDQQSINQMGNATVKAVVVESDITGSQNRIRRIQNAASFK